jgi:hypothetical protein
MARIQNEEINPYGLLEMRPSKLGNPTAGVLVSKVSLLRVCLASCMPKSESMTSENKWRPTSPRTVWWLLPDHPTDIELHSRDSKKP